MYKELSAETKEFFDFMLEYNLMDLVAKKGKAPGGYCTMLSDYQAPFIYSNFNGTSDDIDVLTHEAGHAFQVYMSRKFTVPEYRWPTYEACEIHSMSMEFFTWPWMELFFEGDTDKYKFSHVVSALYFMPYGAAVDEFQHVMYENPEMAPADRNRIWREIEKKYLPERDHDGIQFLEKGAFWQKQQHIFNSPFYYIDYTLAQVCALQYWLRSLGDRNKAWADYVTLCKAGGSQPFLKLVEIAGLRSPFDPECMPEVMKQVDAWLNTIDDKKL
jgi:M3 family oligoendopeptidase